MVPPTDTTPLPFAPLRWSLYDAPQLFAGFDPARPASFADTPDFAIYRHFVAEGRTKHRHPYPAMMQSLHDHSVTQAMQPLLDTNRVAAIMGGHKLARDSASYADVARLARRLARNGLLLCTGGGPGAMEATHLGVAHASLDDAELVAALHHLSAAPKVPSLGAIVGPDGAVDEALVEAAHAWFTPAFEIAHRIPEQASSLAVPTWHYGHEPSTPLASHIAKYFQNSIREDGLLAIAQQGIVFAPGRAGTIQEIFQDGAQNYYETFGHFSPMVLLDVDYWTQRYPVANVLRSLFGKDRFDRFVLLTDDIDEAAAFIETFEPNAA
ncbi:MAG: LOG family protein [Rhodothermales bacterium]